MSTPDPAPVPFVDLALQHHLLDQELSAAVAGVMAHGGFILGPELAQFEREFADAHGVAHAIGLGSGTDALHMALLALGIGPGDEVVTTPNTWISSAFVADYVGARLVLADVDPVTLQLNPARLAEKITPRTRAVVAVHLFGHPAPMDEIVALCRPRGIAVVEDVAQATWARHRGRLAGTIGDIGCFSFYPSKNLGCCGDGGMLITNDADLAHKARMFARYGQTRAYHHEAIGFNSRLDTLQAAILRVKLPHLPAWTERRRHAAARYDQALAGLPVEIPGRADAVEHAFHLYPILLDRRDDALAFLRERGIMAQVHYPTPIHLQPCYAKLGLGPGDLPVAERAMARELSLPLYPEITADQIDRVVATLAEFLR